MTVIVQARPTELVIQNQPERINISIRDANGVPLDPTGTLSLTVTNLAGGVLDTTDYLTPPSRIVRRTTGEYYYNFGDGNPITNVSGVIGDYLFRWKVADTPTGEINDVIQVARVVTVRTMALLPDFRRLIDKSAKLVDEDPDDPVYLGYTDSDLISYLVGGLTAINAYQPYPLWPTLDKYPTDYFKQTLFDAGLIVGVCSQELFAVDTDVDNWSDQGNVFTISHQPKLAGFLQRMTQRLDVMVPAMKKHFVNSGSIHIQVGPNYRLAAVIAAAPTGSLFRNVFFSTGQ